MTANAKLCHYVSPYVTVFFLNVLNEIFLKNQAIPFCSILPNLQIRNAAFLLGQIVYGQTHEEQSLSGNLDTQ